MSPQSIRNLFNEGQKVTLFMGKDKQPYIVTVESIGEDSIEITAPLVKGYYVPVETGSQVELHVGNRNGLFKLPLIVTERDTGTFNTLKLAPKGSLDKIQRRELLRMQLFVDFDLEFPYGSVFKPPDDFRVLQGKRGNLSGGGLFFFTNKPLPVDFKLNVRLNLEPHYTRPVISQAKVVRVEEIPFHDAMFGIAVEFTSIREGDRDKIISYVLHKERDLIKRKMEK